MTEKQVKIIVKYTGVKELETSNSGEKSSYHLFTPVESNNDIEEIKIRYDNHEITNLDSKSPKRIFEKEDTIVLVEQEDNGNNDKKAKDCPTCLERINYELAKCEEWETLRKTGMENAKKGECFHEKSNFPAVLGHKVEEQKKKCSKCQKEYVSSKSNDVGDEKTFPHNCSQKPNQQDDEENEDDNPNNSKIAEKSTVRKYCKDNDIKNLEYDEETGKLIITYKSKNKPKSELDNLNEELQEIKNYLKKEGKKSSNNKRRLLTESD
ncbi:6293_t:CDS:2 [Funneliformis geosporum]|uniref:6293_t:CDS:1 n=1 Tax=Funneliformis geosporum TaxID=1117311 RepID=A0A9W4SRI5_9GLOM|nr:6293_t:CDS:2 [Funneliformis geosporum]